MGLLRVGNVREKFSQGLMPKKWAIRKRRKSYQMKALGEHIVLFMGNVLLCAVQIKGECLPLGACLVAAIPLGLASVTASFGAILGYLLFSGGTNCIELLALTVLMLAASTVFQGTALTSRAWFMPLTAAGVCALLKGIELIGGSAGFGQWMLHWISGGLFCGIFRAAVAADRQAQLILLSAFLCGLSLLPLPINLGLLCAIALCVGAERLSAALAFGIALDLGGNHGSVHTIALLLPALLKQSFPYRKKSIWALAYLIMPGLVYLLFGQADAGSILAIGAGVGLGLLLGRFNPLSGNIKDSRGESDTQNLYQAAQVIDLLRKQLPSQGEPPCVGEAESVFDGAAERVCRCCERFHRCWQNRARETYEALTQAARPMIDRGMAQKEDWPLEFQEQCCHLDGFITAVNQELEGMLFRRRYRMQLQESRQVLIQQMDCVADFLRVSGTRKLPQFRNRAAWLPQVGICTVGKNGSKISGDRGACFAGADTDYYVLLCDGMGTGSWAEKSAGETIELVEKLLKTGLDPNSALKLLNGVELLRGDDRFTTIDLLHLNLSKGKAVLYKWGSAPSYWKNREEMKKIGTASPPPGVGVGGEHAPERYELSLKEGDLLILTSDGAGGEEAESIISMYGGTSPQELATLLITGQTAQDDMSAVVVTLQAYAS